MDDQLVAYAASATASLSGEGIAAVGGQNQYVMPSRSTEGGGGGRNVIFRDLRAAG
jgi:hypothetical protein